MLLAYAMIKSNFYMAVGTHCVGILAFCAICANAQPGLEVAGAAIIAGWDVVLQGLEV
jgi:hypothetical protein